MKKIIFIFFVFVAFSAHAQLNENAEYIKTNYSSDYTQTLRKHAVDKWETDHEMIVYEINTQADALVNLINKFKSENSQIVLKAMIKWSHKGHEPGNTSRLKNLKAFNLENLIKFHCDWEMVEYEYDNQVKSKSSY